MSDLRRDINEVFARQQSQLDDVSGAGNRMLREATAGRRINRQLWPSLAGVALVLIAASAIGVSVVIRGLHPKSVTTHQSPTPVVSPTATPAPTPMSQPLQVPSTTPVILFHDSVDVNQLDGSTWDGTAKGRVAVSPDLGFGFLQNPAGTLFRWIGGISDRTGAVVAVPTTGVKGFGTWADDGQHYCSLVSKSALPPAGGESATLQLTAVGQAPKNVAQVGRMYDQSGASVAACSIEKDRAGELGHHSAVLLDGAGGDIRTSRDGQYIAEISYNQSTRRSTTTIYGPTGAVLGLAAGAIEAFSWDGSLAVQVADNNGPVSVIRWRDGTAIWSGPSDAGYWDAMPE